MKISNNIANHVLWISLSHDNRKYWPQVISYDDWADVYYIIEFKKKAELSHEQSSHNDNRNRGRCVFIICLVIAVDVYYLYLKF